VCVCVVVARVGMRVCLCGCCACCVCVLVISVMRIYKSLCVCARGDFQIYVFFKAEYDDVVVVTSITPCSEYIE